MNSCTCVADLEEEIARVNTRLDLTWSAQAGVTPQIRTAKVNKNGREPLTIIPTHCPFCGTSYHG